MVHSVLTFCNYNTDSLGLHQTGAVKYQLHKLSPFYIQNETFFLSVIFNKMVFSKLFSLQNYI